MKTTQHHNKRSGFTLIEMVGVLAVIAILAALLVPKIFAAIQESRITNAVGTLNSVKAATMNYFSKNGGFSTGDFFDKVLITAGDLEAPFKTRIGTDWGCAVVAASGNPEEGKGKYDLNGDGTPDVTTENVVQCKIAGVNASDAYELSLRLDGADMSNSTLTQADTKGRVVYKTPDGGKTDVYVYIAHK
jgi:prepilin-type N-terminal cleavage/methylation domain-containing protein